MWSTAPATGLREIREQIGCVQAGELGSCLWLRKQSTSCKKDIVVDRYCKSHWKCTVSLLVRQRSDDSTAIVRGYSAG